MDKEYYIIINELVTNNCKITTHKSEIKKSNYKVYFKLKFINPSTVELLSTINYGENLEKVNRIIIELLKNNYNMFQKHHTITLTKPVDFTKDLNDQINYKNVEKYIMKDKTLDVQGLFANYNII